MKSQDSMKLDGRTRFGGLDVTDRSGNLGAPQTKKGRPAVQGEQGIRHGSRLNIAALLFAGFIVSGLVAPANCPAQGNTATKDYQFGPGTTQTFRDSKTFVVPARSNINLAVLLQRDLTNANGIPIIADVPVVVEVIAPNNNTPVASQPATATVVGPLIPTPVIPAPGVFSSEFGCPRAWTVRVRTSSNRAPPVRIFGTITFSVILAAGTVDLDMEGNTVTLASGAQRTRALAGFDFLHTSSSRGLIANTEGVMRIKAKWHTTTDVFNPATFNEFHRLRVELLRPDGTVAVNQNRFSQHAPVAAASKVNIVYTLTPDDARLTGAWRLRITNNGLRIEQFDIERGLDPNLAVPSFRSTFSPQCSQPVGTSELSPSDATAEANDRLEYALTWTVPKPLNWHDLDWIQMRIRDGEDTLLWLKFNEADNTISLYDESKLQFGKGHSPGSARRLQTPGATLYLAESSVEGGGPTGPDVTLNLSLGIKPPAAGHIYSVEVAARDDLGNEDDFFVDAGTLTVIQINDDDEAEDNEENQEEAIAGHVEK